MGALRLFLAISVVVAHSTPLFGLQLMPSFEAVRIFFMISGFYMALVLEEKYAGRPLLFYSNRALRIYPTYWLALALTFPLEPLALGQLGLGEIAAAAGVNFTLFGGDLAFFAHRGDLVVVDPAWSLGTELLFYLFAPALARARTWVLVLLALASFGVQVYVDSVHHFTSYFLPPLNLCFFLYGMLLRRFTATPLFGWANRRLGVLIALGGLAVLFGRELIPFFRNYSWMHYVVAAGSLPFIFERAKTLRWDRWIGELSYPVYVLHFGVLLFAERFLGSGSVWVTLCLTLPASIAVVTWVDVPLDRWRQRRARTADAAEASPQAPVEAKA